MFSTTTHRQRTRLITSVVVLLGLTSYHPTGATQAPAERIVVELRSPAPIVVAADGRRLSPSG